MIKKFITKKIFKDAIKDSFIKLNPKYMIKNPVMFVVEIGFVITLFLTFFPSAFGDAGANLRVYNGIVLLYYLLQFCLQILLKQWRKEEEKLKLKV